MDFTELTIRLLLLFFPGIIATLIINSLTTHKRSEFKMFLIYSFVLGIFSYLVIYMVLSVNRLILYLNGFKSKKELNFIKSLLDNKNEINLGEVIVSSFVAIILAIIISLIINRGWYHKLARKLKITNQFGEKDVWQHLFNSPDITWITVRDFKTDMVYQGYIAAFSDTHSENELLLQDVTVYYGRTGEYLYSLNALYITKDKQELLIEVQKKEEINE